MMVVLRKVDGLIALVEKGLLLVMVTAIVILPLGQIALRTTGNGGFPWGHEVVRVLLLWVAFLGASLATAERRHITIDLMDRSLSPRGKAMFNLAAQLFALVVVGYLARVGFTFIGIQMDMGDETAILRFPVWATLSVIPFSLTVIAWRIVMLSVEDVIGLQTGEFRYLLGPETEGRLY